jgi:hypothetical protein
MLQSRVEALRAIEELQAERLAAAQRRADASHRRFKLLVTVRLPRKRRFG